MNPESARAVPFPPLRRARLGPVSVTTLSLGTAPIGGMFEEASDEQAYEAVDVAWEAGIRYFDTAPLYGHGLAELRLGVALQARSRDEFVLQTKVGRLLVPGEDPTTIFRGTPPVRPVFDFSREGTLRSIADSLDRLGLDRVDIILLHDPDDHYKEALEGAYPALEEMRAQGVVQAIGAGMNQTEMLVRFSRETDMDCFLLAGRYTLFEQSAIDELLPLCLGKNIAVIAGGVFNSGLLAGREIYNYRLASAQVRERAKQLEKVCINHGVPLKAAALQFPLFHPAVVSVLTGARSRAHIEENARLFGASLPRALWEDLRTQRLIRPDAPSP